MCADELAGDPIESSTYLLTDLGITKELGLSLIRNLLRYRVVNHQVWQPLGSRC